MKGTERMIRRKEDVCIKCGRQRGGRLTQSKDDGACQHDFSSAPPAHEIARSKTEAALEALRNAASLLDEAEEARFLARDRCGPLAGDHDACASLRLFVVGQIVRRAFFGELYRAPANVEWDDARERVAARAQYLFSNGVFFGPRFDEDNAPQHHRSLPIDGELIAAWVALEEIDSFEVGWDVVDDIDDAAKAAAREDRLAWLLGQIRSEQP